MDASRFKRLPRHIGIIPDGNRRWAINNGMQKQEGYTHGITPGFMLYEICLELGIRELTFYGFTQDNTKRPATQTEAFSKACVDAVMQLSDRDADLLVVGNSDSPLFPKELMPFTKRPKSGKGLIKINFLVNYGWHWDLSCHAGPGNTPPGKSFSSDSIASREISRIDLVVRWGGRCRLSGFLPVQSVYADIYTVDALWPDFSPEHFILALEWFQHQDPTLGG